MFFGQEVLKAAPYDPVIGSLYHIFLIYEIPVVKYFAGWAAAKRRAPIPSKPVLL
jgi:hypothetical protein